MAEEKAQAEQESAKKHGDKLDSSLEKMDGNGAGKGLEPAPRPDEHRDAKDHDEAGSGPPKNTRRVGRQQR